jgi:hypothetical protein
VARDGHKVWISQSKEDATEEQRKQASWKFAFPSIALSSRNQITLNIGPTLELQKSDSDGGPDDDGAV